MKTENQKRYLVEWTPWDDVVAAAVKNGMPEDGEPSDYTDWDSHEQVRVFDSFSEAAAFAREMVEPDMWHCPRIRRQFLAANDTDDLGIRWPSWESEALWEVLEDTPALDENVPDVLDAA